MGAFAAGKREWRHVTEHLEAHSPHCRLAVRLLAALTLRLSPRSQVIQATPAELAAEADVREADVRAALAELERLRAIYYVPGKGGSRRMILNPWLATLLGPTRLRSVLKTAPPIGLEPAPQAPRPAQPGRPRLHVVVAAERGRCRLE